MAWERLLFLSFLSCWSIYVPGIGYSLFLKPINKMWMTLAILMGWVMTRILLGILFYLGIIIDGFYSHGCLERISCVLNLINKQQ